MHFFMGRCSKVLIFYVNGMKAEDLGENKRKLLR